MLRSQLGQAEGQFVMMATAMERVHSVIDPLLKRTTEAQKLGKVSTKLGRLLDTFHKEAIDDYS